MTRNPDRLVLFTDAVVAIAVTLLILPLVEVVTEVAKAQVAANGGHPSDPLAVLKENQPAIWSFLLSFVVIARFWLVHHSVFEHVKAYNTTLVRLNMLWLLCIVVLPFPTEIVGQFEGSRFSSSFYSGAILVLALTQTALTLLVHGDKELEADDNPVTDREIVGSVAFAGCATVAFLLAALVPGVHLYGLLALIPSGGIAKLISSQRERRTPSVA